MKKKVIEIAVKMIVAALTAFVTAITYGLRPVLRKKGMSIVDIPLFLCRDSVLISYGNRQAGQ